MVIRLIQHKDRSAILQCYTDEFGLRSYAVRASKKTPLSLFQPLTFLDMSVQERNDRDVQTTKEITLHRRSIGQSRDVIKSSLALFIQEFLVNALKEESADTDMYELIEDMLTELDEGTPGPWAPHLFLVRFAAQMGILPPPPDGEVDWFDMEEGVYGLGQPAHGNTLSRPYSGILPVLQKVGRSESPDISCTGAERREMLEQLLQLFRFHTDGSFKLRSPSMLREVLS